MNRSPLKAWQATAARNEARQAERGVTSEAMTRKTLLALAGIAALIVLAALAQYAMHG